MIEGLKTDLTKWELGPYHSSLPGPMKVGLCLDGEVIVSADVETGFLHRGLEKCFELHLWQSSVAYVDHLDPEAPVFGELALCLAVEELAEIEVSKRAQEIRVIFSELCRISSHMGYVVRMGKTVNAETMVHYVLRDREKILDLFELLSGSRFSPNFLRFGGVRADVTEGFIERVLEICELLRFRLKEYNDLFTYNHSFVKRTQGVARILLSQVKASGMTGPNARASGSRFDVRKLYPYSGYEKYDFSVTTGLKDESISGDVHDRFVLRLREMVQSVEILKQVCESILPGKFLTQTVNETFAPKAGEAYARVETARGLLGCHVVSDGTRSPARIQFRVPTNSVLGVIPEIVRGIRMEDLPLVLASLDLGIAEADR